jgi:RHS repeat-associated protein
MSEIVAKFSKKCLDYYPFGLKHSGYNSDQLMYIKQGTTTKIVPVPPLFKTSYNFKFNSKMLEEDLGLNVYDYGARFYDPASPRFWQPDPKAETSRRYSTYAYALDNPVYFIDADGMEANPGDFINEQGKKIGSDGISDGKMYAIKTTRTGGENGDFDSKVKSAGITKSERNATEDFIKKNSGNTEAFKTNDIAYKNSVEYNGNKSAREGMMAEVGKDDGRGGTSDENNREHGGRIKNSDSSIVVAPAGPVCNPTIPGACPISIETIGNQSTFHDHPSGTVSTGTNNNSSTGASSSLGGSSSDSSYLQAPSQQDIDNSTSKVNYEFARGENRVYMYNNTGVLATMPDKNFVNPK